jgi:ribosome biogenesis protein BMS1
MRGQDEEEDKDDGIDSDEETAALRWKDNLQETARRLHGKKSLYRTADLARHLYDDSIPPVEVLRLWKGEPENTVENVEQPGDDDFFRASKQDSNDQVEDRSIPVFDYEVLAEKWTQETNLDSLKDRFATAGTSGMDGDPDGGDGDSFEDGDDEGDGVFEDLEAGETQKCSQEGRAQITV